MVKLRDSNKVALTKRFINFFTFSVSVLTLQSPTIKWLVIITSMRQLFWDYRYNTIYNLEHGFVAIRKLLRWQDLLSVEDGVKLDQIVVKRWQLHTILHYINKINIQMDPNFHETLWKVSTYPSLIELFVSSHNNLMDSKYKSFKIFLKRDFLLTNVAPQKYSTGETRRNGQWKKFNAVGLRSTYTFNLVTSMNLNIAIYAYYF